jgi:hypothetical protein
MAPVDRSKIDLSAILTTVETIRAERFSGLDAALVEDVLRLHADPGGSDAELARKVEELVEQFASRRP